MGLAYETILHLIALRRSGRLPDRARVIEIGAQQLSNSFLRAEAPIESVAKRLEGSGPGRSAADKADGEVALILMLNEGTEVEVRLPGRFKVSPQIAGAIKAVTGVVAVEVV